jgi:peptide/nickel transport system substrate-binding protein
LLYASVDTVEAVDATTLRLQLNEPNGAAYLLFSTIHPVIQASAWEGHLAAAGTAADFLDDGWDFAAGPYQLATRQNPGEISLVPNPAWMGEQRPTLDRVQIATYEDSAALVVARSRQELDVIWVKEVAENDFADAAAIENTEVQVGSSNIAVQLSFNHQSPALADINVRGAIALAVDRVSLADQAVGRRTGEAAQTWNSLVFATEQEGNTRPFDDPVDIDLGNELLDGTVWERPDNLVYRRDFSTNSDLELELLYVDSTESANAAFNITQDLQEIGINVLQTKGTAEQVVEQFEAGDFDLLLQFRVFNNDPIATDLVFGTDGCPAGVPGCSGVGVNYGAFSNAAIDQLLTAADATTDLDARLDVYADIDRALASEFAAIPLYVRPAFTAYDTSIVGIEMAPNIGPLTSLADWGILDS